MSFHTAYFDEHISSLSNAFFLPSINPPTGHIIITRYEHPLENPTERSDWYQAMRTLNNEYIFNTHPMVIHNNEPEPTHPYPITIVPEPQRIEKKKKKKVDKKQKQAWRAEIKRRK